MTPWVVGLVGTIQPSCALSSQISLTQLCWQHKFLSRIPIWAAHYSYKSGGHKQCIGPGPVNVRSIWSPARQAWTLRTTHGLYCIKLKHAETEWIYQLWSFSSLSLPLVPRPSQTSHFSVSDLLLFLRLQTSNTEWLHFLLLWEQWCEQLANYQAVNSRSQNKLNLPQILEIIKFLPSLPQQQLWSRAQWNSNVLMIERALSSQLTTPSTPLCSAGTVGRCGWGELNRLAE